MICRVYFDVDMRMGVKGLTEMLKDKRVAVGRMKDADMVLFLNRGKTHFKLLCGSGHLVMWSGQRRLTMNDIEKIPLLFGSERSIIEGKNLDKVHEIVGKELKSFEDGELKVVGQ